MLPLEFLWDEEKTRKLFKTHLLLFTFGAFVGLLYSLILPPTTPYKEVIFAVPLLFLISTPFYFLILNKPNPGIKFLIFSLQSQLAASIFMAVTGGFLGIVQFAPYMFLVFTLFELGPSSAVILAIFSAITFIAIYFWTSMHLAQPNALANFLYFSISYSLIVLVARNLGQQISVQLEAKRKLEEVDDLKNQFISLASHYLRTPLTVLKGFIYKFEHPSSQKNPESDLQNIKLTVYGLEELTENLLLISSIEKGEAKIFLQNEDLKKLLESVIKEFEDEAQKHSVSLYLNIDKPIPMFKFDPYKLKVAIGNLIDNGIKYNKPLGKVKIEVKSENDKVFIRISDTGLGIKKEHLDTLFTPFNRGEESQVLDFSHPGTGLSLYITKLIVEAHKGKVIVQSNEGSGSVFTITLPLN